MALTFQPAHPKDRSALQALLTSLRLPTADLPEDLSGFTLAFDGENLVGSAGLQPIGPFGLLRSVAVHKRYRSQGIGQKLYAAAMDHAYQQQVQEVWLITASAAAYFEKLGFERLQREGVPAEIAATSQLSELCPSTAVVMRQLL